MVYRLLGWGVVGEAYHKIIRLFLVLVQILHLIMELVHRLRNILRFSEVGGIQRSKTFSKSNPGKQKLTYKWM